MRYYRKGETRVLLPCLALFLAGPAGIRHQHGLGKATLGASLQTTLTPQPDLVPRLWPTPLPDWVQPVPGTQPADTTPPSHDPADSLCLLWEQLILGGAWRGCTGPSRQGGWELEEANASFLLLAISPIRQPSLCPTLRWPG